MIPHGARLVLLIAVLLVPLQGSRAQAFSGAAGCEAAIATAEAAESLPRGLLGAIGRVESGRFDPQSSTVRPWPWTINADGIGRMFETEDAAIEAVRGLQAQGVRSIDVGCLQVNLLQHRQAFATLEQAFDPATNVAYAAHFLRALFAESQDWPTAAAAYHSRTPDLGASYRQLVLAAWGIDPPPGAWPMLPPLVPVLSVVPRLKLRPFAPPALTAAPVAESHAGPDAALRLLALAPDCAGTERPASPSWTAAPGGSACVGSPFASVSLLRRALAADTGQR
jgi:hypothetical protein